MVQIPAYPQFVALDFEHKEFFDQAFNNFPPELSEFTFTNLFSWRKAYDYRVCLMDGLLILRLGERARFLQPVGAADPSAAMARILNDSNGVFIRVAEDAAGFFKKDNIFKVEEDRDNWDYLYLTVDLINLAGRKYDGKRNQIKKFTSEHEYVYMDIKASQAGQILEFEESWCAIKGCDQVEGLNNEREAMRQIIAHYADFRLKAGMISVEGKISALAIAETLNPETLVVHMLKADPVYFGLYQVMLNDFLRAQAKDLKYVNLEQDLGIAGLRASKESYHALRMIKKYSVSGQ